MAALAQEDAFMINKNEWHDWKIVYGNLPNTYEQCYVRLATDIMRDVNI